MDEAFYGVFEIFQGQAHRNTCRLRYVIELHMVYGNYDRLLSV